MSLLAIYIPFIFDYLVQIGPIFLFLALVLGIVGLPVPDELLLIGAGYLVAHQKLHMGYTVLAALTGSMIGITVSYLLGRLVGHWLIKRYGPTLNITPEKVDLVHNWFRKLGKWLLILGYYIPLFRHLVGFVAGGAKMEYKTFALFAYVGAILWALIFLSIGYYTHSTVNEMAKKYHQMTHQFSHHE